MMRDDRSGNPGIRIMARFMKVGRSFVNVMMLKAVYDCIDMVFKFQDSKFSTVDRRL
jgi:hypothetical protein